MKIMHRDSEGVSLMPYYLIEFLDEMLFFEFTGMLKDGQCVKRCKLCGRYFVLTDKRRREFCDRLYQENRTCKKVGPKVFFDKDVGGGDYLRQYLTEYNKVYSLRYRADGKYVFDFKTLGEAEDRPFGKGGGKRPGAETAGAQ